MAWTDEISENRKKRINAWEEKKARAQKQFRELTPMVTRVLGELGSSMVKGSFKPDWWSGERKQTSGVETNREKEYWRVWYYPKPPSEGREVLCVEIDGYGGVGVAARF